MVRLALPVAAFAAAIATAGPAPADASARSDRWLTYGQPLQLTGPGQVNPQLAAGARVANPQDASTRCSILQTVVVNPPVQTSDQLSTGNADSQLKLEVQNHTVLATLSGNCVWQRQT